LLRVKCFAELGIKPEKIVFEEKHEIDDGVFPKLI
jgi:hypothetical protein